MGCQLWRTSVALPPYGLPSQLCRSVRLPAANCNLPTVIHEQGLPESSAPALLAVFLLALFTKSRMAYGAVPAVTIVPSQQLVACADDVGRAAGVWRPGGPA